MRRKEHEERCIEFFGKPYAEVHEWLDYLYKDFGYMHRTIRHTPVGVDQVVMMFGEDARCPALLHLYDDMEYFNYYNADGKCLQTTARRLFDDDRLLEEADAIERQEEFDEN